MENTSSSSSSISPSEEDSWTIFFSTIYTIETRYYIIFQEIFLKLTTVIDIVWRLTDIKDLKSFTDMLV